MTKTVRKGAKGALLDEYERALVDLHQAISDVTETELTTIVDKETSDLNCKSIQTILAHVVRAGYNYAVYIQRLRGNKADFHPFILRGSTDEYKMDTLSFLKYTEQTLEDIPENELEECDNAKKILSQWGQIFDIDQMMEHAIVHILRHRRQIEKFKIFLRN